MIGGCSNVLFAAPGYLPSLRAERSNPAFAAELDGRGGLATLQ